VEISVSGGAPELSVTHAIDDAFAAIERVQVLMSYHDPNSDVSRLNRFAAQTAVRVDPQTYYVLSAALELFERSHGIFDIAIAPVLTRWKYLPRHYGMPPLRSLRGTSASIELLPDCLVRFDEPLGIDLGGIAKGYAVDCAVAVLQAHGFNHGLVNAGGDLRAFGPKPQPAVVRHPTFPREFVSMPPLSDAALATSAGYFCAKRWRGQTVSPLVNPLTEKPCVPNRSVSVRAPTCMLADALCKIVSVGHFQMEALLEHYEAESWILTGEPSPAHVA
jgi:thiamine biosynthesis lipoprotein